MEKLIKKLILIFLFIPLLLSAQVTPLQDKPLLNPRPLWYLSEATTLSPVSSTYGLTGYTLRLNTATANYHVLSLGTSSATNLNGFNIVQTDINKVRTSLAQATDTSSVSLSFLASGKPIVNIIGATGNVIFNIDSTGAIGFGQATDGVFKYRFNGTVSMAGSIYLNDEKFIDFGGGYTRIAQTVGDIVFSTNITGLTEKMRLKDNGNLGLGTIAPLHKLALVSPTTSNNFAGFNITNAFINKTRTTLAQSEDTASVNVNISALGSPTFNITGKTGNSLFKVDSVKTTAAMMGNTAGQAKTLDTLAVTFAVTSNVITVTGNVGTNTIATITGAVVGVYVFIFVDANVTITDTDAHTADTVDLAGTATNFTSADDKTLTLVYDGTSWYQTSTSTN